MEKTLEKLSTSALGNLLIEEVKTFIVSLDNSPMEDLQRMKRHLRKIFDLIEQKKEHQEATPLVWGTNSAIGAPKDGQLDTLIEMVSEKV